MYGYYFILGGKWLLSKNSKVLYPLHIITRADNKLLFFFISDCIQIVDKYGK